MSCIDDRPRPAPTPDAFRAHPARRQSWTGGPEGPPGGVGDTLDEYIHQSLKMPYTILRDRCSEDRAVQEFEVDGLGHLGLIEPVIRTGERLTPDPAEHRVRRFGPDDPTRTTTLNPIPMSINSFFMTG